MGTRIRLTASDGHEFGAYLAEPEGTPRGALIVGMEMYGVNGYLTGVCDAYAAEGYLAIAPALFERFEPDLTLPYDDVGSRKGKELSGLIDHSKTMLDVEAAASRMRPAGKVAIMGFCFGGTVTWLAACRCDLDAGIAYYGSNMCDYPEETARCPVICHVGDLDTAVPPADVAAFQEKHPDVYWYVYEGVQHGFDNQTRPVRYDADATTLAHERSLAFLRDKIG
ncbi:MAG: dienelactone hydrolase family protein [Rhodospirillaceae bacterium]|nr:dienelactone hydrolase family protein [Rhodospirillaceae bacterium]MBT5458999.1 dienelactone hydrolase family protein [Rhodospirillaceae bacterium]